MEINDFLNIAVVGVALSGLVSLIKMKFGTAGWQTKALTLFLSLAVAGGYVWIKNTPYFETVVLVLGIASTVYAFLVRK